MLYTVWPPETFAFNGATEHMPDGRLIFRGPRVAMAIHETEDFECAAPSLPTHSCSRPVPKLYHCGFAESAIGVRS